MSILDELNPAQRKAAENINGPVLILAGAGSGKTRALTYRIAYLVGEVGVRPENILAVTFTNKAANEMKERVERLIGWTGQGMWIGTFHSVCARILRREADGIGCDRDFAIYDQEDQLTVIKKAMKDLAISEDWLHPRSVRSRISRAKNSLIGPRQFAGVAGNPFEEKVAEVYREYQEILRRNNAFDFDDLLLEPIELFTEYPDVLEKYQDKFQYILVDEWQDTNRPQYVLVKMLAAKRRNLCVVGDDDQSIYQFRGADLSNILNFEKDYPDARVIRMERNYRSTKRILAAGNAVIRNNMGRKGKELWTEKEEGAKPVVFECLDEKDEARRIARTIEDEMIQNGRSLKDFVLLYRTNAQSRALEDELRRAGLPYTIVGGIRFYERKEVKDVLAYLKLISNPQDSLSLRRVINTPQRGIGERSLDRLEEFALENDLNLFEALSQLEEINGLSARPKEKLKGFRSLIEAFIRQGEDMSILELAEEVVSRTGYLEVLRNEGTLEAEARAENVRELLSAIGDFAERSEDPSLDVFLEEVSLITDIDRWDDRKESVTLMTLHSAKGLEFPVVFITGLEDGLFPLSRAIEKQEELEEERRLFYVGITRAQERLFLSLARERRRYGLEGMPSRFLGEIPADLIEYSSSEFLGYEEPSFDRHPDYEDFSQEPLSLDVGDWVVHRSWGRGKILEKSGVGERMKLVVEFQGGIKKKLLVKYASLQPG